MKNYFATNLKHLRTINKDTQQSLTDKINASTINVWIEIYDNLGIEALYIDKNRNFVLK